MTYSRLAQRAMALACFLAPILFLSSVLVHVSMLAPQYFLASQQQAAASITWLESGFLAYEAGILFIPAFFALTALVGQRAPRLAIVCAVMGLYGLAVTIWSPHQSMYNAIATRNGSPIEFNFFTKNGIHPFMFVTGLPHILYHLATIFLGVSALRTGVLPRWAGALLIAAGFLHFDAQGPNMAGLVTGTLTGLCYLLVYPLVGARLWSGQDEAPATELRRAVA